jgi:hypothetical protein
MALLTIFLVEQNGMAVVVVARIKQIAVLLVVWLDMVVSVEVVKEALTLEKMELMDWAAAEAAADIHKDISQAALED